MRRAALAVGSAGGSSRVSRIRTPGWVGGRRKGRLTVMVATVVSSMILLEVHGQRIAVLPGKGDAPGAIDVDGIALRLPPQAVEIEARLVQFGKRRSRIERVQTNHDPGSQAGGDLPRSALLEKLLQPLVPEAQDHRDV